MRRWLVAAFYLLAVSWGIRNVFYWQDSYLDLLIPLSLSIVLGWWAMSDAKARSHPIPMLAAPWFIFLAGIVVPGYLVWSRGGWGIALVLLHLLGWYGLATIAMYAGGMIVFGNEWLRAMGL